MQPVFSLANIEYIPYLPCFVISVIYCGDVAIVMVESVALRKVLELSKHNAVAFKLCFGLIKVCFINDSNTMNSFAVSDIF